MDKEIKISDIIAVLMKRIWLIVLCATIGFSLAYIGTKYLIPEMYTTNTSLFVRNDSGNKTSQTTQADLNISLRLVDTYMVILESDSVLNEVANKLDLGYTAADIRKMLKFAPVNNTEVIRIAVTNPNPVNAQLIANTIAQVAPGEIIRVVKAGSVEILDKAKLPEKPSSPNVNINSIVGIFLGIMISLFIAFILEYFNIHVKSESDLRQRYKIPVLGTIPHLNDVK